MYILSQFIFWWGDAAAYGGCSENNASQSNWTGTGGLSLAIFTTFLITNYLNGRGVRGDRDNFPIEVSFLWLLCIEFDLITHLIGLLTSATPKPKMAISCFLSKSKKKFLKSYFQTVKSWDLLILKPWHQNLFLPSKYVLKGCFVPQSTDKCDICPPPPCPVLNGYSETSCHKG